MATRRQIVTKSKRLKAHKVHKLRRNKLVHEKQTKTVVKLMNKQKRGGARPIDVPFSNAWGADKTAILKNQLSLLEHAKSEKAKSSAERKARKKLNAERAKMGLPPLPTKAELDRKKADVKKAQDEALKAQMRAAGSVDEESSLAQLSSLNANLAKSHVVLYVLDARDPMGSRSPELERHCAEAGRPIIYILNKFDLITRPTLNGWLRVLRNSPPPASEFAPKDSTINTAPSWTTCVPFSARCARASVDLLNAAIVAAAAHHRLPSPTSALIVGTPRSGRGTIVKACLLGRAVNNRGQIRLTQHVTILESTVRVGGGGRVDLPASDDTINGVLPSLLLRSRRVAPSSCKLWLGMLLARNESGAAPADFDANAYGGGAAHAAALGLTRPHLWAMMCCAYAVDQRLSEEDLVPLKDLATKGMTDAAARAVATSERGTAAQALLKRIAAKRNESIEDVARLVYMQWEGQAPRTPRWWVEAPEGEGTPLIPSLETTREIEAAVSDYAQGHGGSGDRKFMALPVTDEVRINPATASFLFEGLTGGKKVEKVKPAAAAATAAAAPAAAEAEDDATDSDGESMDMDEEDSESMLEEDDDSDDAVPIPVTIKGKPVAKPAAKPAAKPVAKPAPKGKAAAPKAPAAAAKTARFSEKLVEFEPSKGKGNAAPAKAAAPPAKRGRDAPPAKGPAAKRK